MAFQGFDKNSGPSIPPKTQTLFGSSPQPPFSSKPLPNPPHLPQQSPTSVGSPPSRDTQSKTPLNDANLLTIKQTSPLANFVDASNTGIRFPVPEASRFGLRQNVIFDNAASKVPSTMRSPLPSKARHAVEEFRSEVSQRPAVSPPQWGSQPKAPLTLANSSTHKTMTAAQYIDAHDTHPNFPAAPASFQAPKRTRSPSLPSTGEVTLGSFHFAQDDSKRKND